MTQWMRGSPASTSTKWMPREKPSSTGTPCNWSAARKTLPRGLHRTSLQHTEMACSKESSGEIMNSAQADAKEYNYFADNEWRKAANNEVFEVHEPYGGKLFARVAAGSRADARTAVDAAAKAFAGWAETTPADKARLFLKASDIVKRRRSQLP